MIPLKHKKKYLIGALTGLLLFLFCTLTALYLYLPRYIEKNLLPEVAKKAGIDPVYIDIRRVGALGFDLGDFKVGDPLNPAFLVNSVRVDYSPVGLVKKDIKRVTLSGIEINCALKDGKLQFPGLDLEKITSMRNSTQKTAPSSSAISLPVSVERLEIKSAVLNIKWRDSNYRLPFEFTITPRDRDGVKRKSHLKQMDCRFIGYLRDQEIYLNAAVDLDQRKVSLELQSATLLLTRFADLLKVIPGLDLTGEMILEGKTELQIAPLKILSASAACRFSHVKAVYRNIEIQNARDHSNEFYPFSIDATFTEAGRWKLSTSALEMISPAEIELGGIESIIHVSQDRIDTNGNLTVAFKKTAAEKPQLTIPEEMRFKAAFSGQYEKNGKWHFNATNVLAGPASVNEPYCRLKLKDINFTTGKPQFTFSGEGTVQQGETAFTLLIPEATFKTPSETVRVPELAFSGNATFTRAADAVGGSIGVSFQGPGNVITLSTARIKIPAIAFSGEYKTAKESRFDVFGELGFKGGGIWIPQSKIRAHGLQGNLPIQWPPGGNAPHGVFSIAALQWDNKNLGGINGSIQQVASGLVFKGAHNNKLISGLTAGISGSAGLSPSEEFEGKIDFQLKHKKSPENIDIGYILPKVKGITANGDLVIDGNLTVNRKGLTGALKASLNHGKILLKEKRIAIEGIQVAFGMQDLLGLRSGPGQTITFEKAAVSNIVASEGRIDFQIESTRSFFIEKSRFRWCNGNVETQPIRISPGVEDYNLVLYCDRLNLAKILEQFGAAKAKGGGNVNGRIPVRYHKGKISFNDAFLFSTPGNGGTIHLTGTEMLTAGLPPGTVQYAQMDLAREALKDYTYDWAKLRILTEGDDILLKMEFDGKPAEPLPFIYKKEIGGFARVDAGSKGSHFRVFI